MLEIVVCHLLWYFIIRQHIVFVSSRCALTELRWTHSCTKKKNSCHHGHSSSQNICMFLINNKKIKKLDGITSRTKTAWREDDSQMTHSVYIYIHWFKFTWEPQTCVWGLWATFEGMHIAHLSLFVNGDRGILIQNTVFLQTPTAQCPHSLLLKE